MAVFFNMLKEIYRLLPEPVQRITGLKRLALKVVESAGNRDDIYSPKYYQTLVEPYAQKSVPHIAKSIVETFIPQSVVDVGCGSGALLAALRRNGVYKLLGLDVAEAGLDIARARALDVRTFDITFDRWEKEKTFNIAVSMEVAEHLPEESADRYVELLCSLAPVVIFTAAHPGQGGIGHLNEQPLEYWIAKFQSHGFQTLEKTVAAWQADWRSAGVADFYTDNLMIFQKEV